LDQVSDDGLVAVGAADTPTVPFGFRWTQSGGTVNIGTIDVDCCQGSRAFEANADGSVIIGGTSFGMGNQAFRWTQATGPVALGDLPGGSIGSTVEDITPDGQFIVGSSVVADSPQIKDPFVWDEDRGMRNLRTLLETATGMPLVGWELSQATGISADLTVITGIGTNPAGQQEGWVMLFERHEIIPEPSSVTLAGLCLIAAVVVMRQR
jgi:uncharacterized membrane protein